MRKKNPVFALLLVFPLFSLSLFAQDSAEEIKFFPTRLSVGGGESSIELSWEYSGEQKNYGWEIYRHTEAINGGNFSRTEKIAELSPDTFRHTDTPPSREVPYYYAVLARNGDGAAQEIFIPFANTNLYGVSVFYTAAEEEDIIQVTRLAARVRDGGIVLTYTPSRSGGELLVYRGTGPISSSRGLLAAVLVDSVSSDKAEYRDQPIPGVEYYYAVIDTLALKSGKIALVPGENTTAWPSVIPFSGDPAGAGFAGFPMRPQPLPRLSSSGILSNNNMYTGTFQKEPQPLTREARAAVDALMDGLEDRRLPAMKPYILPADRPYLIPGAGAQDQTPAGVTASGKTPADETPAVLPADPRFYAILENEFLPGHYETAADMLAAYRQLPRNREVQYKLHFYLGQAYFFLGDHQNALMEFLFAEEAYYAESQPFLSCLFHP